MLNQMEQELIQTTTSENYIKFMSELRSYYPLLKCKFLRKKASKLWKARKEWLLNLEPTIPVLCVGCLENQPNQLAHMDYGGCLYTETY
jgi:hypothetical protein